MIERLQAKRNEEGFTLIELLIVIIVLGILAAIVVFAIGSTRKDSVASACKTNVKAVELSSEAMNTKNGTYYVGSVNSANAATTNVLASSSNGALLKSWPSSDSDYILQYVGTASAYNAYVYPKTLHVNSNGTVAEAIGADATWGTADDNLADPVDPDGAGPEAADLVSCTTLP